MNSQDCSLSRQDELSNVACESNSNEYSPGYFSGIQKQFSYCQLQIIEFAHRFMYSALLLVQAVKIHNTRDRTILHSF